MHVLTVCYGHPADPAAFDAYYTSTHVPLAEKIPGLTSFTYRHCDSLDASPPPYYLLAELSFPSAEALNAGLSSPEGAGRRRGRPQLRHRRRHHVRRPRLRSGAVNATPVRTFVIATWVPSPRRGSAMPQPQQHSRA